MAGTDNLIPLNQRTKEEQKEITTMGGKASGEARREKRLFKDLLEEALLMETETGNKYVDITISLIEQARSGNVKAFEVIRDTMGQKPVEKTENNITIKDDKLVRWSNHGSKFDRKEGEKNDEEKNI